MVLGIFKKDKNGNIQLASRLYVDPLGRDTLILWGGDPEEMGSEKRERLQAFRLDPLEALALLGYLRAREEGFKDAVVREQLEREGRSY